MISEIDISIPFYRLIFFYQIMSWDFVLTFYLAKSIWIYYLIYWILQTYYCIANCFANSHGIYYDFTIFFAKSLWIHFLSSEFPMNSLSVYRIYNGPNIHYGSIIFLWIQYKLTSFFANIH